MIHTTMASHQKIPVPSGPDLSNPVPEEPAHTANDDSSPRAIMSQPSNGSLNSLTASDSSNPPPETPTTPFANSEDDSDSGLSEDGLKTRRRRASTKLIASGPADVRRIISQSGTQYVGKVCCGGGCCWMNELPEDQTNSVPLVTPPDNDAYRSLNIKLAQLTLESKLTGTVDLPEKTVSFSAAATEIDPKPSTIATHPPAFVQPHPPHSVFSARIFHARELTQKGAEKRTIHFDLDVTDYPEEIPGVDFRVGGAIGVSAPNDAAIVDEVFDCLGVPGFVRDKKVTLHTTTGRWPTVWGDEIARDLQTTRRELLTWCSDIQSYAPNKQLYRVLAEYASDATERKILTYLASAQGQAAFCDLRTGPHVTLPQLLNAFPSSHPPVEHLFSILPALMPRFYSLSQDPHISCERKDTECRRLVEIAVSVHETQDEWRGAGKIRTGVGSGFLERQAHKFIEAEAAGVDVRTLDLRVPMFRGLMSNPLAKEFTSDGPMLLIGAGVGIAPFRGFVQRRLKQANCANKVWVLQGVRDSLLDELYRGEWGVEEEKVKQVVQSRKGRGKYVQEEVRNQADLVWFIINSIDGRIFVCGSSKGMGEGVENALIDVAIAKGGMNRDEAGAYWKQKKEEGQYIAETW